MARSRFAAAFLRTASSLALGFTVAAAPVVAGEVVDRANSHIESGQYGAAVIELENALQQDPGDVSARLLLGELYLLLKNGAGAEKELLRAEKLGTDSAAWRLNLVEALLLQGKYADALDRLDQADTSLVQEESRYLILRGLSKLGLRQYEDAERDFDRAIALDADNQGGYLGKVRLRLASQELEEATAATDELLLRFPDSIDALLIRAELHRAANEMSEAAKRFGQVLKLEPDHIGALLGRATTMIATGDFDQARAELDHVDEIHEDLPMTQYLRGVIAFKDQAWEQASEYLQEVLLAIPDHLQSRLLLGIISYSGGELQTAEEHLSNVVEAMPGNAPAVKVLGATRIRLGQPEKAISVLEPFAEQTPDAQSMALLASAYMLEGDQERGQEWFNRAVEAAPDVASLRTKLALTLLAGGETEKAINELQSAVDLGQDVLQADLFLVLAHLKNRELDKALEASEALRQRMPDSAIVYNMTGLALLAKGDKERAGERFQKALELDPEFVTAALNLARIAISEGNLDAAQKYYEIVLDKRPTHLGAMLAMAALSERRDDPVGMIAWLEKAQEANPASPQPGLQLATHYISEKQFPEALSVTEGLAQRFPQDVQVLMMLARAQAIAGENMGALRSLGQAAQLRPEDAQLQYVLGRTKLRVEDFAGARIALGKAISIKPDHADARAMMGSLEIREGRVGDALAIAEALQQDFPDAAVGYGLEGRAHLSEGRSQDAVRAFETAYSKEKSSQMMQLLARARADAGRRGEAIEVLEGWTKEQPDDLEALRMLAMYYQMEERDGDAITAYETLVDSISDDFVILNNLAWLYHEGGDQRAIELAKRAYELSPDRPEIADTYGWILLENGNVQEGLSILQQAYVGFPTHTEIGYHVAVGLSRAGRKEESIKVLRRLLRQDPNSPKAEEIQALLAELEN